MKLLFDQNLSDRLVQALAAEFPDSAHIRHLGMERASDGPVWDYAKENGYVIVSKDSDFHQRSFLYGHPPKVIWIRRGNCSTATIETVAAANPRVAVDPEFATFCSRGSRLSGKPLARQQTR